MENKEIIIVSLDKLRCISSSLAGLRLQVMQLETLLSEARNELIKLKEVK